MFVAELLQLHRLEEAAKCATLTNSEQVSPLKKKKRSVGKKMQALVSNREDLPGGVAH